MSENINIDELLNGFIDGELSEREETEIQRLIRHDPKVAERLSQLKNCKTLVSSLPCAEAPADLVERVASRVSGIANRQTRVTSHESRATTQGARHLLMRKVLSAAAMIGLATALAAVVYTIVAPDKADGPSYAISERWKQKQPTVTAAAPKSPAPVIAAIVEKPAVEAAPAIVATARFAARLEVTTDNFSAVNAFIDRLIEENALLEKTGPQARTATQGTYALNCTRQGLNSFLAELKSVWPRLDSATLVVEASRGVAKVVIPAVTVEQIEKVANQQNYDSSIRLAKDFAVLNSMTQSLPGKEILVATNITVDDFIPTIPKPVLTTGEKTVKKSLAETTDADTLSLTVVIVAVD